MSDGESDESLFDWVLLLLDWAAASRAARVRSGGAFGSRRFRGLGWFGTEEDGSEEEGGVEMDSIAIQGTNKLVPCGGHQYERQKLAMSTGME